MATNPFFSQAQGKSWNPAKAVAPKSNPFWSQGYVPAGGGWHPGAPTATSVPAFTPPAPPTHAIRPGPTGPSTAPVPTYTPPVATAAPAAAPPAAPPGSPPPLDATAQNNEATNLFNVTGKVNSLGQHISDLRTNLQAALGNLAYQQPRDELKTEQAANNRGALYSSVYNQNLGDLIHQYATKQTGLTTTEGQDEGAANAQIQALLGGIPLYNQGQANASVARAIAAAAANPATGQPPAVSTPAPSAAPQQQIQLTPEQVKYINAGLKGPAGAATQSHTTHPGTGAVNRTPITDPFAKKQGGFTSTIKRVK